MKNSKKRIWMGIFAFILFLFMSVTIAPRQAEAAFGVGEGNAPTSKGYGYWFNAAGTGAYDYFVEVNVPVKKTYRYYNQIGEDRKDQKTFENNTINKLGKGFKIDNTTETLATSCSKSDYIWWYGDYDAGGYLYIQTGGSNYIPAGNWQKMDEATSKVFEQYKTWSKDKGDVIHDFDIEFF